MIEWKVGNDGWDDGTDAGERLVVDGPETLSPEQPASHPSRRRRIAPALSALVLLVIVAGISLKWRAGRNLAVVRAAVQSVIDQEGWAFESGNWELYESLLDPRSPAGWFRSRQASFVQYSQRGPFTAEITDLALVQPDPSTGPAQALAITEVRVDPPDQPAYRETRAYFSPLAHSPSCVDTTIAEYVVESYGRHRLADIVKAATRYADLHDLIPAALGVDIGTFEAGWRAYLEQAYGDSNQ